MSAITSLEQVTPTWLTAVLRRHGLPLDREVAAVEVEANPAFNSLTVHLDLAFAHPVPEGVPHRLVLKRNRREPWAVRAGAREVEFYRTVAALPEHPPVVVRCLDAAVNAETGDSHLLLEDLSGSHVTPATRDKQLEMRDDLPDPRHLDQVVDTLASLHAFWWESPHLGTGPAQLGGWCRDAAGFAQEVARRRRAWDHLLEHERSWFPSRLAAIYELVLDRLFALWRTHTEPRLATFRHLTLTHGDAYPANFLCPPAGREGGSYLIDWQSPEVYRGASDLVTLCATFWTREQRLVREEPILRRYLEGLRANGVRGYDWVDLVTDYRCSIVDWLLIPLQDRLDGAGRDYWFTKIECLANAFEDWGCRELLEGVSPTG